MKRILLLLALFVLLAGCYSNQLSTTKDSKAYLKVEGDKTGITIVFDDMNLELSDNFYENDVLLEVKTGIYIVKIYRDSKLIVERKLIFEAGQATEIQL